MSRSQTEILEEMLQWLKFTGIQQAKEVVDDALSFEDNEEKERDSRIAYELTDGDHSQRDIGERISYSRVTVGNWQDKWSKLGIIRKNEDGHYEHLISLEELGLECPPIPDPDEEDGGDDENDLAGTKEESEETNSTDNSESKSGEEREDTAEQATLEAAADE
jgi:hypothetical protein